ncbi:MAG: TetR/AcrR family transcriptional regulator [Bdellovibrionales bacterium]
MSKNPLSSKEKIIIASIQCFARYGFESTTFKQIADLAKITQPALYSHFKDKVDLLDKCCRYAAQKGQLFIESYVNPKGNAEARLRDYIRANLQWFHDQPNEGRCLLALYYYGHYNSDLNQLFFDIQNAAVARIETYISHGSHENKWSDKNAHEFAKRIHSVVVGELIKSMYEKKSVSVATHETKIWNFISKAL